MTDEVEIFLVRVNYKSGIQEEFWCTKFNVQNNQYTWEAAFYSDVTRPVVINPDNIESVWQIRSVKIPKGSLQEGDR